MDPSEVLYVGKTTITLIFHLSMPIIVGATTVGLIVALVQTLIQLQEQTLGFAVKLSTVVLMIFMYGGWMGNQLLLFTEQILTRIGNS